MSEKNTNKEDVDNFEADEAKILYGVNPIICFACGQKLDKDSEVCPYCNTTIK